MKTCPYCGATTTDDVLVCQNCGRPAESAPSQAQPTYSQQPYAQQPYAQQPYAQQPYTQQPYAQQPYAQQPYAQAPNQQYQPQYGQPYNRDSRGSRPLVIFALCFSFIAPVIGLILSAIGLNNFHEPNNRGICKASLIISIVRIALVALLVIISYATDGFPSVA